VYPRQPKSELSTICPATPYLRTSPPPRDIWYGVEEAETQIRRICRNQEDLRALLSQGATLKRTFHTRVEAEAWVNAGPCGMWYGVQQGGVDRRICDTLDAVEGYLAAGYDHTDTFFSRREADLWLLQPAWRRMVHGPRGEKRDERAAAASSIRRASHEGNHEVPVNHHWYGLVDNHGTGSRVICHLPTDLSDLLGQGAILQFKFTSEASAIQWLRSGLNEGNEGTPLNPQLTRPTPPPPDKARETPSTSGAILELHQAYMQHQGTDPSVGDKDRIFGIVFSDTDKMYQALGPPGLETSDCEGLVDRAMDVLALPGMSRMEDFGSEQSAAEEVVTSLVRQLEGRSRDDKGHDSSWSSKRSHHLSKVKSDKDIKELRKQVRESYDVNLEAQNDRMRTFLMRRGFTKAFCDEYFQVGLLPRIVRITYENYMDLLTIITDLLVSSSGDRALAWKSSRAEAITTYHARKLLSIRTLAPNYYVLCCRNYTYLRDGKPKDYRHEAMQDYLWEEFQNLQSGSGDKGTGDTHKDRCSHCRHTWHTGGKTECPASGVTQSAARALLKGVQKMDKAKALVKEYNDQAAKKPTEGWEEHVKAARKKLDMHD
jgi:hypothetical protein